MADELAVSLEPITVTADPIFAFEGAAVGQAGLTPSIASALLARANFLAGSLSAARAAGSTSTVSAGGPGEGGWVVGNGNGTFIDEFGLPAGLDPAIGPEDVDSQDPFGEAAGSGPVEWGEPISADSDIWPSLLSAAGEGLRGFPLSIRPKSQRLASTPGQAQPGLPPSQQQMAMVPRMLLPGIRATGVGAMAVTRGILRLISINVGRRVTARNVAALVRSVGLNAAAVALGVTAVELAQVMFAASMTKRRRRGISHRDISRARSTIRRMTGFMAQVQQACSPAMGRRSGRRRHAAGCACVVCRRS